MTNHLHFLLPFAGLLLLASNADAGFTACPACVPTCLASPPACWPCIIALCAASCFSKDTTVERISNHGNISAPEQINVADINAGDVLLTLDPITKATTHTVVTSNDKLIEPVALTTVFLQSANGRNGSISVTPDHGVIVSRHGKDVFVPASNVMLGDSMYSPDGSFGYVTSTAAHRADCRYALQTAAGTVLASDVFVGTLCGSEISIGLHSKLHEWKIAHGSLKST